MSDDLIAFLSARLDEDEMAAKAATPGPWYAAGEDILTSADDPHWTGACAANASGADAAHIARHDPARALREVAAHRAIVASLEEDLRCGARTDLTRGGQIALLVTCKRLAAIYSDHPDYRHEWR